MKVITSDQINDLAKDIVSGLMSGKFARVGFVGPLGAGKTTTIKSILKQLGIKEDLASPTFTIVKEYQTEYGKVCHADLYRVDPRDKETITMLRELIKESRFSFVEWADRSEELSALLDKIIVMNHSDQENTRTIEGI